MEKVNYNGTIITFANGEQHDLLEEFGFKAILDITDTSIEDGVIYITGKFIDEDGDEIDTELTYGDDNIIDEFIALDKQIKAMENRRTQLAEIIKADMLASGMDKAEGTDGYVRLQVVEDKVMPAKDAYLRKGYSYLRVYR